MIFFPVLTRVEICGEEEEKGLGGVLLHRSWLPTFLCCFLMLLLSRFPAIVGETKAYNGFGWCLLLISPLLTFSVYMDYGCCGSVNSSMSESFTGNSELVIQKVAVQFFIAFTCRKALCVFWQIMKTAFEKALLHKLWSIALALGPPDLQARAGLKRLLKF